MTQPPYFTQRNLYIERESIYIYTYYIYTSYYIYISLFTSYITIIKLLLFQHINTRSQLQYRKSKYRTKNLLTGHITNPQFPGCHPSHTHIHAPVVRWLLLLQATKFFPLCTQPSHSLVGRQALRVWLCKGMNVLSCWGLRQQHGKWNRLG
jgi:hypothetical protein